MAEKLCSLGVIPSVEIRGMVTLSKARSIQKEGPVSRSFAEVVRKDLGVVGDAVCLQPGESEVKSRE